MSYVPDWITPDGWRIVNHRDLPEGAEYISYPGGPKHSKSVRDTDGASFAVLIKVEPTHVGVGPEGDTVTVTLEAARERARLTDETVVAFGPYTAVMRASCRAALTREGLSW